MPLIRRTVLPKNLCQRQLPENGINELEMVTNNTLAGVISQLSDLSRHAEDIFGELTNEAHQVALHFQLHFQIQNKFNDRCRVLGERITTLNSQISLDVKHQAKVEPGKTREIQVDNQVVSRVTLPKALRATYHEADPPPPLQILQVTSNRRYRFLPTF